MGLDWIRLVMLGSTPQKYTGQERNLTYAYIVLKNGDKWFGLDDVCDS
jgi:hypothetical protein